MVSETSIRDLARVEVQQSFMHLKSFSVKRRSQLMEEHRPKKLLDQVRACPELAEGMPSA